MDRHTDLFIFFLRNTEYTNLVFDYVQMRYNINIYTKNVFCAIYITLLSGQKDPGIATAV